MKSIKLKLKLFVTFTVLAISNNSNAQAFEEGVSMASLGFGFPNLSATWMKTYSIMDADIQQSSFGPLHLKFEYGLTDKLGIGASFSFTSASITEEVWDYTEKISFNSFKALIRLNYHYLDHDKVDFYTGIGMGYNRNNFKFETTNPSLDIDEEVAILNQLYNVIPLGFESTIGLRYLFTDNIGAYMELGWSKSLMQFGVVGRF